MRPFSVRFIRPGPFVHTRSGHIGLWTKMRRSAGQFSGPESSLQIGSLADFITATSESRFSVPTVTACRAHLRYRRNATTRYGNRIAILSELTEPRTPDACGGATGHAQNGQTRDYGAFRYVSSYASNRQFAYQPPPDGTNRQMSTCSEHSRRRSKV